MKGYKGFDKNLKCRDFQYEVGKTFEEDVVPKVCEKGLHFCEYPLDVLRYYEPVNENRFCEVEALGDIAKDSNDTKVATNKLKISAEISLKTLIDASIKFVYDHVKKDKKKSAHKEELNTVATNTGYSSVATNTGDSSVATNTGNRSVATNTGYSSVATNTGYSSVATNTGNRSVATNTGKNGIAASFGREGQAKGAVGSWLVLTEWVDKSKPNDWLCDWEIKEIKAVKVDGETIKEDTLYTLKNGNIVEVSDVN